MTKTQIKIKTQVLVLMTNEIENNSKRILLFKELEDCLPFKNKHFS